MRYSIIQVASGMLLFSGDLLQWQHTGSLAFDHIGLDAPGGWLIFLAFGIKCAFPLLHNWLQDAYPEATEVGAVFLSAFTTKLAVYALARGFAGTEMLISIGALMTAFPIFYAVIENDLRKVLAYSLNNQLGFMVVGIGIGTELSLNGAAAHAFAHILYKALLFMSMGAVLYRVGTVKGSELGGLYKSMPLTTAFCIVGAASISGVAAVLRLRHQVDDHLGRRRRVLSHHLARAAVRLGRRVPPLRHQDTLLRLLRARFRQALRGSAHEHAGRDGHRGFLCIGIGVLPGPLYALLPYPVDYAPYTSSPRAGATAAPDVLGTGFLRADVDTHLSAGIALHQPRFRLGLSRAATGSRPPYRGGHRLGVGGHERCARPCRP